MRAVNLLPEKHRPRRPSGGGSGSSYFLLGALGVVVLAVLLYVMTANSINSAKTDIADAKSETARANAQAQALGAYGDFAKIKQQRVDAVKQVALARVDWERMVRELAHVLPAGVWIQSANAADSAANQADGGSASSGTDASASSSSAGGPVLTLQGCAPSQAVVAETLVRLREMQGASDVKLDQAAQPENGAAGDTSGGTDGSSGGCGLTHGKANYTFQVDVSFEAPAQTPYKPGAVPTRLGGGQ